MSESSFLNLVRGNRLSLYLGLELDPGVTLQYSPDYTYLEIPARGIETSDGIVTKALRNQHVRIQAACKINVRGHNKVLVKVNPRLQEVATCPTMFLIDTGTSEQAEFYATFRKDFDLADLGWCIRLYMLS